MIDVKFFRIMKPYQNPARRLLAVFGLAFKSDLDAVHKTANETLEEYEKHHNAAVKLASLHKERLYEMMYKTTLIDLQRQTIEGLHEYIREMYVIRDANEREIEFQRAYIRGLQGAATANKTAWARLRHHMSVLIVKTELSGLRSACRAIRVCANRAAQGDLCGILSLDTTLSDKPEQNHVRGTPSRQGAVQSLILLEKARHQNS